MNTDVKEKIFAEQAKKVMIQFDMGKFIYDFTHLYKVILNSMEEYAKAYAPVPGKEEIIQDMVERIEKIILSPNKESERNVFNKAKEIYGLFASTKQSNESVQQAAKEWREKNAKFVPDNQSEIMLEKSFLAGASFNSKDKSNQ